MAKKATTKKKASRHAIRVISPKGITVHIEGYDDLDALAQSVLAKFALDNYLSLASSMRFTQTLSYLTLDPSHLKEFEVFESYRICFGGLDPLSIAGNLAVGGRFNIGGAQLSSDFQTYNMFAAIYTASSLDCAKAETGPSKNPEIYKVSTKKKLKLWDLKSLISSFANSQNILELIEKSPYNTQWRLQKFPTPSQLLSAHLKVAGGDGLFFPSTKDTNDGIVYCIYLRDEKDANSTLDAARVPEN